MTKSSDMVVLASRRIQKSDQEETLVYREGGLDDIIEVIMDADRQAAPFTKDFAPLLRGKNDYRTLYNIWRFIRKNIRYVADAGGHEKIKSPGATWASRYADCKSMSVFAGSILRNLGFSYVYKVVFYDKNSPEKGHIYPVVLLEDGRCIPVDAVHYQFDEELPYWRGYHYHGETGEKVAIQGTPPNKFWPWLLAGGALLFYKFKIAS